MRAKVFVVVVSFSVSLLILGKIKSVIVVGAGNPHPYCSTLKIVLLSSIVRVVVAPFKAPKSLYVSYYQTSGRNCLPSLSIPRANSTKLQFNLYYLLF